MLTFNCLEVQPMMMRKAIASTPIPVMVAIPLQSPGHPLVSYVPATSETPHSF